MNTRTQVTSEQRCSVCEAINDPMAQTCASCGAFLRDRIATLDFFQTVFGMIDQPRSTFLRIARSEQKNYVFMLYGFTGIALLSYVLFLSRIGDHQVTFASVLAILFLIGPLFGLLVFPLLAWIMMTLMNRLRKEKVRYRLTASFVAYALIPFLAVSFVLVPVELGVFGDYLFSINPAPWQLKPMIFWILASLNAVFFFLSIALSSFSFTAVGVPAWKNRTSTAISYSFLIVCVVACSRLMIFIADRM